MHPISSFVGTRSKSALLTAVGSVALTLAFCGVSKGAAFTPGDLVLTRAIGGAVDTSGGAGSAGAVTTASALLGSGAAASVVLDEYTPAGVFVQSVPLPNVRRNTVDGAGNFALTFSGTQNTEGAISVSADGNYFVVGGYNATGVSGTSVGADPNFMNTSGGQAATVQRVVGLIDMSGNVNTTTALTDTANAVPFRSAYSSNGTDIWANGTNGGVVSSVSTGGLRYATLGSTTSTQIQATGQGGTRAIKAFNGQLFFGNTGTPANFKGVNSVDTNFAGSMAAATPVAELTGFNGTSATSDNFWFQDANTLYVADENTANLQTTGGGGIQKWTSTGGIGGTWSLQYVLGLGATGILTANANNGGVLAAHGLTGVVSGGITTLYATSFEAGGGQDRLWQITDGGSAAASTSTLLALSATNSAFRGVEIVPTSTPEPTSLALLGLAGLGMIRRSRRA